MTGPQKVESRSQESQALFPRNGTRLTLFAGLAFMLISSGVQWVIGRPFALTSLSAQDDEGYMLVLLHLSADGHALYSQMYSQYGPMFHWIWNALFSVLDLEYTLSTGRLVTVACWVVASLGFGVATQRLTQSILGGLAAQWVVFMLLGALVAEPMHPNGIIAVFLALLTVIVSFTEDSRTRWASIGLVLAVVLCIKVNAGLLLVLAIVFSISTRLPYLRKRRRLGIVMSAACAVPALLLVRSNVWLLLLTLLSICFLGVALHRLAPMSAVQGQRCLQWFGGALIGGLVVATACAWLVGSPPDVLWRALAIRPLGLEDAFSIPFAIPGTAVLAALTSVFILAATARGQQAHTAGVRIAIGGLGSGLLIALGPALVLPLSWVSLLKERVSGIRGWELPALATWFLLTVFPVAGSQVALASILFVPVLLQMLAGGLRDIVVPQQFATRPLFARILAVALILASATLMIWSSTEPIRKAGSAYESREPLVAGDASGVRLTPDEAKILRDNAQWVRENCDTFYSFPGLNTYYVLTSLPVPGSATATTWWALLDDAEQQKVIADMEQAQSPCFLRFNALTNFWLQGRPVPSSPLLDYLTSNYTPVQQFNSVELLQRKGR